MILLSHYFQYYYYCYSALQVHSVVTRCSSLSSAARRLCSWLILQERNMCRLDAGTTDE